MFGFFKFRPSRVARRKPLSSTKLLVESLEDRLVPSAVTTNPIVTADVRLAVTQANAAVTYAKHGEVTACLGSLLNEYQDLASAYNYSKNLTGPSSALLQADAKAVLADYNNLKEMETVANAQTLAALALTTANLAVTEV